MIFPIGNIFLFSIPRNLNFIAAHTLKSIFENLLIKSLFFFTQTTLKNFCWGSFHCSIRTRSKRLPVLPKMKCSMQGSTHIKLIKRKGMEKLLFLPLFGVAGCFAQIQVWLHNKKSIYF